MEAIISVFSWLIGIAIGGLILVGLLILFFWLFKFLCTVHAEIIAEKMREELEDILDSRQIPMK